MKNKFSTLLLSTSLLATLAPLSNAHAEIAFNGFASIVAGSTTSKVKTDFEEFENSIDFKEDSLFALQVSSDLGDKIGVTAQIIARGNDNWKPEFEWAYISYDASDDLRFLVGKQRAPFYMYSDFLDVSYAYPWITPPRGVYNLVFDTFDGIGAIYNHSFGEIDSTLHVIYGANKDTFDVKNGPFKGSFDTKSENLIGAALTLSRDWLTLRGAYFTTEGTFPISALENLSGLWTQAGFTDVASRVQSKEDRVDFLELGFQVDYNDFIMVGEYTKLTFESSPFVDQESFYVMFGKRFDNILVHYTYGQDDDDMAYLTAGVPVGVNPLLDQLVAGTNALVDGQKFDAKYSILGLRWDFHESTALKLEYKIHSDKVNPADYDVDLVRMALVTVF